MSLPVGMEVGSTSRIPYSHAHVDGWGAPHKGTVLALNDVRVWEGTVAFIGRDLTQEAVDHHVTWVAPLYEGAVPVLWHFSDGDKVHMEDASKLQPYAEVVAWVEQAKADARTHYPK